MARSRHLTLSMTTANPLSVKIGLLILFLSLFFSGYSLALECRFPQPPSVQIDSDLNKIRIWEIFDDQIYWSEALPKSAAFERYQEWVRERVDPDPFYLIRRQQELFLEYLPSAPITRNFDMIIDKKVGNISPITCLEALLFSKHTARFPLEKKPSEFFATILARNAPKGRLLKIYFLSWKSGCEAPQSRYATELWKKDVRDGWIFLANLHNHPLVLDGAKGEDIAGTTIPSSNDIEVFRHQAAQSDLRNAWITNGFSTIHFRADEFDELFTEWK